MTRACSAPLESAHALDPFAWSRFLTANRFGFAEDANRCHFAGKRSRHWVAVASADHVRRGRSQGFMQAGHGKMAPLRRVQPGDCVVCYSPTETFGGKDKLQAFTAIGIVKEGLPYQIDAGGGFCPFRRDVVWLAAEEQPIRPLLDQLDFTRASKSWGYQLRRGLFEVSPSDMGRIAQAMGASLSGAPAE